MGEINFSTATDKLVKINHELEAFGLSLVLDYKDKIQNLNKIYSFSEKISNKLTLCLIKKSGDASKCNNNSPNATQQCVSSIEMDIYGDYPLNAYCIYKCNVRCMRNS